jgi:hypothetical protein
MSKICLWLESIKIDIGASEQELKKMLAIEKSGRINQRISQYHFRAYRRGQSLQTAQPV